MKKKSACKDCKMEFDDKKRLDRHIIRAHPRKRKFVNPDEYWREPGAGL